MYPVSAPVGVDWGLITQGRAVTPNLGQKIESTSNSMPSF